MLFAVLMPFVAPGPYVEVAGLALSQPGLGAPGTILAKGTLGVVACVLLAATTTGPDLLLGLQRLQLPALIVTIATFMLRYVEVMSDEMRRMRSRARPGASRPAGPRAWRVLAQAGARCSSAPTSAASGCTSPWSPGGTPAMPALTTGDARPAQWSRRWRCRSRRDACWRSPGLVAP